MNAVTKNVYEGHAVAKKKVRAPGEFRAYEPTGAELKAFRQSIIIDGKECTQEQMAGSIQVRVNTYATWEQERGGRRCKASDWTLIRIAWDDEALTQWEKTRPKRDT